PNNPTTSLQARDMQAGANALKLPLDIVNARSPADFDDVFATLVQRRTDALVVSADSVFLNNRDLLVALTARRSIPTIYTSREFVDAGGLMSYGSDFTESFRAAATYVGRILKGDKTADLPVIQSTKFELVINVRTAKATGFKIPDKILALADEVVE